VCVVSPADWSRSAAAERNGAPRLRPDDGGNSRARTLAPTCRQRLALRPEVPARADFVRNHTISLMRFAPRNR